MSLDRPLMWPTHDLLDLAELLRSREVSSLELIEAHLARIDALNSVLHACVTVMPGDAHEEAQRADELRRKLGDDAPRLLGIPIAVKDNFEMRHVRSTAGSAYLSNHVPNSDAAVVERLRRSGSVFVAKTNLDELALGVTSVSPVGGATLNPWDAKSTAGGSSGGSGAAVSAGMCAAATASDTGGSIRNPSAWNGVTGLKPTYGVVSAKGLIPLSWSLDTAGFLAHTTTDCALLFAAAADHLFEKPNEAKDEFVNLVRRGPDRPIRFGAAINMIELADPAVRDPFLRAVDCLDEQLGAVVQVELPRVDDSLLVAMIIILAEGAAMYEHGLRSHWSEFGQPVRALLDVGRLIRASEYLHAQRVRERIRLEVSRLFERIDALLMPSMGLEPRPDVFDTYLMKNEDRPIVADGKFRCIWNLTGYPVLSIPCGFTDANRPIAMSIVTAPYTEDNLLQIGVAAEAALSIRREQLVPTWVRETEQQEAAARWGGGAMSATGDVEVSGAHREFGVRDDTSA